MQGGVQGTSSAPPTKTDTNTPHARAWGNNSDSLQVQQAVRATRPPPPALQRQQQRPMAPGSLDAQGDGARWSSDHGNEGWAHPQHGSLDAPRGGEVMMRGYENRTNGNEGWAHQPQGFSPNTLALTQQQVPTLTLHLQGSSISGSIAHERTRTATGHSLDLENSDSFYC